MDILIHQQTEASAKKGKTRILRSGSSAKKNRRKISRDRRRSVNEGIIVSLSLHEDRRTNRDRRRGVVAQPIIAASTQGGAGKGFYV